MTSSQQSTTRTPHPWWIGVIAGMASFIDGAALASFGTALVLFGTDGGDIGVLTAILTLGIAVGAATGGRLGDAFGRRAVFTVTMGMIAVAIAILVFMTAFPLVVVATALLGLGVGADLPVSIATISEAATDKNRGKLVSFSQTLWFAGQVVTVALSAAVGNSGYVGGQILLAQVGVVALIVLVLRLTVPESSVWQEAKAERRAGATTLRAQRAGIGDVLRDKVLLMPFLALLVFYTCITVGSNTFNSFAAYIAVDLGGISIPELSLSNLVLGLPLGVICALLFMRVADTRFRMTAYMVGAVAWLAAYSVPLLFGITLPSLIATIAFGTIAGGLAGEAIMRVWSQETFPTLVRASVQGAIICVARVVAAGAALVAPQLLENPPVFFATMALIAAVGLIVGLVSFRRGRQLDAFAVEAEDAAVAEATVLPH